MRNKKFLIRTLSIIVGLACLILPMTGFCGQTLTDSEKLMRVYALYAEYKDAFPGVSDISAKDAMQMMKSGQNLVFVDTRSSEEMAVSMLPKAISQKMFLDAGTTSYKDSVIVSYCTISYRSGLFARNLAMDGQEIFNLRGGLLAWVLEGGEVFDRDGATRHVHVWGDKWKLAPEGYEMIVFPFWKQFFTSN